MNQSPSQHLYLYDPAETPGRRVEKKRESKSKTQRGIERYGEREGGTTYRERERERERESGDRQIDIQTDR